MLGGLEIPGLDVQDPNHEILTLNQKHARIARFEFQLEPEDLETLSENESNPSNESSLDDGHWEQGLDDRLDQALKTLTDPERGALLAGDVAALHCMGVNDFLMGYLARFEVCGLNSAVYNERIRTAR